MEKKAYDLKLLGEHLKAEGLDIAEDALETVYKALAGWLKESAELSENKIDDVVGVVMPYIDGLVLPAIDKVDGEVDE